MGNFASSVCCASFDSIHTQIKTHHHHQGKVSTRLVVDSLKTTIASIYEDIVASLAGSSVVISDLNEAWYQELLNEADAKRNATTAMSTFLGPSDTTVASVDALKFPVYTHQVWSKPASHDDDDSSSYTADETDDESKCDYSDSDGSEYGDDHDDDHDHDNEAIGCCGVLIQELEYHHEDNDTETKVDCLQRLVSMQLNDDPQVYVDDYLCPCGECPQYARIARDVLATVTWRNIKEQGSITRVLQAFSTYNEIIGYSIDMIETAEECLQLWLGDEDKALTSFVMLYDKMPQLCGGPL